MLELSAGQLRLTLDPETGGAIAAFTRAGVPLLRPVADPRLAAQHGRAVAGYPLIPFANRVAWGRFEWAGISHQLALNFGDHPHTIHGNAWMRPWNVVAAEPRAAHLVLRHTPPADPPSQWPFAYQAEQMFRLHEAGLDLEMSVRNTDSFAWPAGLGLHPYIARDAATRLGFDADTVWLNGADSLPDAREAVAHHWDFSTARPLGEGQIDECYAGWGGIADVMWPRENLTLRLHTSPPLDHLQLYTPPGRDFFGLEPVSNMPDAINRMDTVADNGLTLLAPGETLRAIIRFEVTG
jgi:aldose 1-epimerase